jgi:hypothetical protein
VGKRQRRRQRHSGEPAETATATSDYTDPEGNVLTLRDRLSPGTVAQLRESDAGVAATATADDRWQRREELLFERLAVRWTIAELPLEGQRELLGRYRMAGAVTREWVRKTMDDHLRAHQPDALP